MEAILDDLAGHPNIEMKLFEQIVDKAMNGVALRGIMPVCTFLFSNCG